MNLTFTVPGQPVPKGSMKFVGRSKRGKPLMTHDNQALKGYMERIKISANIAMGGMPPVTGAIALSCVFYLEAVTGKTIGDLLHKRDLDKMTRSVMDALTGIVYVDDGQVAEFERPFGKHLSPVPRTQIQLWTIGEDCDLLVRACAEATT